MGNYNRDRSGGGRSYGRRDFGGRSFGRDDSRGGDRPMYKATCSNCGRECEVPFRPTSGKPVYCSDCFEKMGGRNDRQSFDRPRFEERKPSFDQNTSQFDALNVKLDRIITLLEPKVAKPVAPELVEEKKPKTKKVAKKAKA